MATGSIIYHMCDAKDFDEKTQNGEEYFSPTFSVDRFIHATGDPQFLLEAGNHFYLESKGNWVCLKIDVSKLSSQVVYEAPAPVGVIEAIDYEKEHNLADKPKFPHIYGGISKHSVMEIFKIIRNEKGEFLSIEGLI